MNSFVSTPPAWQATASDQSTSTGGELQTFQIPTREPVRSATRDACLVFIYPTGPRMGTRYPLANGPVAIGRGPHCTIQDENPSVSREHALIIRDEEGEYRVSDLGSTNGTFVNNATSQGGVLRDGDYLRVGNCLYRFLSGGNIEAEYHEEIYRLTVLDGLTQVHNRRYLNDFIEREVVRAARHNRPLALVLVDIDHFKMVNDKLGHLAGDLVLRELCARIRPMVGPDELLARYGGEEFAIVLPEATAPAARATAERIRHAVASRPFVIGDQSYSLTVSLGVAVTSGTHSAVADLFRLADNNLYQAKANGRNRVVIS